MQKFPAFLDKFFYPYKFIASLFSTIKYLSLLMTLCHLSAKLSIPSY